MPESSRASRSDAWGGAGWVGLGLLIVVASWRMERFESMGAQLYTMPGFVPGMLGGVIMLLGVALMLRAWHRGRQPMDTGLSVPLVNARIAITLALTLFYAGVLVGRVPFWLATAVFVAAFVAVVAPKILTAARRWWVSLLAGGLTAAVVTGVFQHIFLVRLP